MSDHGHEGYRVGHGAPGTGSGSDRQRFLKWIENLLTPLSKATGGTNTSELYHGFEHSFQQAETDPELAYALHKHLMDIEICARRAGEFMAQYEIGFKPVTPTDQPASGPNVPPALGNLPE